MKRIILFSLSLFLFSVLKPDYIHSQDKDGINKIIQQNLEGDTEGTNAFVDFLKDNEIFVDYYEQRKTSEKIGTLQSFIKTP